MPPFATERLNVRFTKKLLSPSMRRHIAGIAR